jgi:hypothetical protein
MTPYQAWYGEKPDLSRLRVIGSRGEYLVPPKQRKKLTEPRTRPCILLGYEGNANYRILLEDGRIVGTPNAEFQEALITSSTQTRPDVGAEQDGLPRATAAATGGSVTVGLLNQSSVSIRQASVPASGRHASLAAPEQAISETSAEDSHILPRASTKDSQVLPWAGDGDSQTLPRASDDDSQILPPPSDDDSGEGAPSQSSDDDSQPVVEQGDRTLSPFRSDDTFSSFSDVSEGDDSLPNGGQQRDDAQRDQALGERQRLPEHHLHRAVHEVRQQALEYHPELRIRVPQATSDTSEYSMEELALMGVSEGNVLSTFLTVAAEETEPFEPKSLYQAKNDTSWPEWERSMLEEVDSLKQNKTWELVDPPTDQRVLSGKWVFKLKRGPHGEVIRHKSRWVVRGRRWRSNVSSVAVFDMLYSRCSMLMTPFRA